MRTGSGVFHCNSKVKVAMFKKGNVFLVANPEVMINVFGFSLKKKK